MHFRISTKYLLNIHSTCGSKSRKTSSKYKIFSLFNKLRDIEDTDNTDKENITKK